jgi:hypothetical protein
VLWSSVRSTALLASLSIAACATEPSGAILEGQWGGPELEIVASVRGAQVNDGCAVARFFGPLRLDDEGELDIEGTFRSISWRQSFRLQAVRSGNRLQVHMTRFYGDGDSFSVDYTLTEGTALTHTGLVCPA